jgi:hypothetical protein
MGRGKKESPTIEFEPEDLEELEYLAELVEREIGIMEGAEEMELPESDLERVLRAEGLTDKTWFEVYWSG